jgi:ATP-dependent helicase HrpA
MITKRIQKIESLLPKALAADRYRIESEIMQLRKIRVTTRNQLRAVKQIKYLEARLRRSMSARIWREKHRPMPTHVMGADLPISAHKQEIIATILKHQVAIVAGETGSGKTTQLPQYALEAGRGIDGMIGGTQPRRIAATSVTARIAAELMQEPGQSVGYKIRFKDRTNPHTFIKIMTDGILLAEAQRDPLLSDYDTLIVDEAHERSLNIDFILGVLRTLLPKRPDLKLIVTSATIDTEKFSKTFDGAPVIEVSGRMFPIEMHYQTEASAKGPSSGPENDPEEVTHIEAALEAVEKIQAADAFGDILVFMPTEQDIRETCELIAARNFSKVTILPLFARLPGAEQGRVFGSYPGRKIIVATNVAETSLTIPGIKYVVDTGLARISHYSPRTRTTSLPVRAVSKSSADQRAGRCGRVRNGVCYRLYTEEDYEHRPRFTAPEILRANLAEVILRMLALNMGDIAQFPFIDQPTPPSIKNGFELLIELGAIKKNPALIRGEKRCHKQTDKKAPAQNKPQVPFVLTKTGRLMAKIPLDPRLSRMLLEARRLKCLSEVTIIVSALSIADPRERPLEHHGQADGAHRRFADSDSDFVALLNIWNRFHDEIRKGPTNSQKAKRAKRFCRDNFLSYKRMREWQDIQRQIKAVALDAGIKPQIKSPPPVRAEKTDRHPLYIAIHKAILSGFLAHIALKKEKNIYAGTRGKQMMLFPGSGLFNQSPTWIVAAEVVMTSRLFARINASIDPKWLEAIGKSHCTYTYLHPHWERSRGQVVVTEQVSLFGLMIVAGRKVAYGRINPEEAAAIFIESALVQGDVKNPPAFMRHNRRLIDSIEDKQNRLRRQDLLVSEADMVDFYTKRLPKICDMRSLAKLIKDEGGDKFLEMNSDDLLAARPDENKLALFPPSVTHGGANMDYAYRHAPGETDDGVTLKVPAIQAARVAPELTDWLVPGLLPEKIKALIKGLPKVYRKQLVPVARSADIIVAEMKPEKKPLVSALSDFIHRRFKIDIPARAWSEKMLPDHLKLRIALTKPDGSAVAVSRNKAILRQAVSGKPSADNDREIKKLRARWEIKNITKWNFGALPKSVTLCGPAGERELFIGLSVSEKTQVIDLRLFEQKEIAVSAHKKGVSGLCRLYFAKDIKYLKKWLSLPPVAEAGTAYFGGTRGIAGQVADRVVNDLFDGNVRTPEAFADLTTKQEPLILPHGNTILATVAPVLESYKRCRDVLAALAVAHGRQQTLGDFVAARNNDLEKLVSPNFITLYNIEHLKHFPRYIGAIILRAQNGVLDLVKDQKRAAQLLFVSTALDRMLAALTLETSGAKKDGIEELHWLIEEYKVSLFAQALKTAVPVSAKRLKTKIGQLERMV